jgi:hypothetical protein
MVIRWNINDIQVISIIVNRQLLSIIRVLLVANTKINECWYPKISKLFFPKLSFCPSLLSHEYPHLNHGVNRPSGCGRMQRCWCCAMMTFSVQRSSARAGGGSNEARLTNDVVAWRGWVVVELLRNLWENGGKWVGHVFFPRCIVEVEVSWSV